ncbi:MAG: hypothetical protein AB7F98_18635, partial [Novosphingobium sp.]
GEIAQAGRTPAPSGTAGDWLNARDAAEGPRNIRTLDSPSASQRAAIGNGSQLDDLVRRGDMASSSRRALRQGAQTVSGEQTLGRQLLGQGADVPQLLQQGDAAQAARGGKLVNEAGLMREVAKNGGDITELNRAGRTAQAARQAGSARALSKADDLARIASTGAKVGRAGRVGRAALAATGAGAVAVAAEVAATEGVKALTGAEIQDPLSTGFQYGAAIFDKDVTIADVASQRMEHHKENFRRIGETLTTEGKIVENLTDYADSKNPALGIAVRGLDQADRRGRAIIKEATGVELERRTDVVARYGAGLKEDGLKGVASVAGDRARHHMDNAAALTDKVRGGTRAVGSANRRALGDATGADLRSVRETTSRYKDALSGDNKAAAMAGVARDRARHHANNAKQVGSRVSCGIGNIFRSKRNDRNCKD